jgi:hypothetical protein
MRRNPERLAWAVTLAAFVVFCTLAVSIPIGVRWYLTNSTRAHQARVTCLEGTAVVEDPARGGAVPLLKGEEISVPEGTVVSVDDTAQARISLFDQSFVVLRPRTSVTLDVMRSPRYGFSPRPAQITLQVKGGGLWASTVLRGSSPVEFTVNSLQANTLLAEDGGYTFEVSNERTEVIVQRGTAEVTTASTSVPGNTAQVTVSSRQRTVVEIGRAPLPPMSAERDLIVNGDFGAPLNSGWLAFNDQGGDGGDGTVSRVEEEGRRAVRFFRADIHNHCETIIEQEINRDLPEPLTTVQVRATIKLVNQTLSGGGYLSSEYPLLLRLRYRDEYGSEDEWIHGFYYQNVQDNPTMRGQEIAQNQWHLYESDNLLDVLPIEPRRILSLRVSASGWGYESLVSEISLIVE